MPFSFFMFFFMFMCVCKCFVGIFLNCWTFKEISDFIVSDNNNNKNNYIGIACIVLPLYL